MTGIIARIPLQRAGGRCEPATAEACIAHPGVACVREAFFSAGRRAPLQAEPLQEGLREPHVNMRNQGGTASMSRPYRFVGAFLFYPMQFKA